MKITIEQEPGWFPPRIPKRARPLVLLLTLVIGVPVVLATDRFADVPPGVHHDDVTKLASAGVTVGCGADVDGNPLFCPGLAVSREQMASFLVRGLPRIATGTLSLNTGPFVPFATADVEIDTGIPTTAAASTGFLRIDAFATLIASDTNPCRIQLNGQLSGEFGDSFNVPDDPVLGPMSEVAAGPDAVGFTSVALTYSVEVGAGTYTLSLDAHTRDLVAEAEGCSGFVSGFVNVMYVPFDGDANNDTP